MYFSAVDVRQDLMAHVQSAEDISSGYSSGEVLFPGQGSKLQAQEGLVRTGSIGSTRPRSVRITRSTIVPKKTGAVADVDENIEFATEKHVIYIGSGQCQIEDDLLINEKSESSSDCEFLDPIEYEESSKSPLLEESNTSDLPINLSDSKLIDYDEKFDLQVKLNASNVVIDNLEKNVKSTNKDEPPPLYKSKSVDSLLILETKLDKSRCSNVRSGKYHKKAAPLPPSSKDHDSESIIRNVSTIKATLVLTPSITKTGGTPNQESTTLDVTLPSPKLKQRSVSKSPSRSIKNKQESALARFMMLPKKLNFWHKDEENKNTISVIATKTKRSSWYSELPQSNCPLLLDSKPLSKSVDNFQIINLSHSPKRRKKVLPARSCKHDTDSD